jgi:hypothetical protein
MSWRLRTTGGSIKRIGQVPDDARLTAKGHQTLSNIVLPIRRARERDANPNPKQNDGY